MRSAASVRRPYGALDGVETCLVVAAAGFLVQAALILVSPVSRLVRQPELVG
jgi:hypothetical protein